jgi:hypothetical protein
MGKPGKSRQAKFGEKGGKKYFFSKDAPLIHFIHPKVQKYMCGCLGKPVTWSKFKILCYLYQLKANMN